MFHEEISGITIQTIGYMWLSTMPTWIKNTIIDPHTITFLLTTNQYAIKHRIQQ